jgi:hypothetical protein
MGMDSDELAREAVRMNRAIARCLHHLAAELPADKQGDFVLLFNDLQIKNVKMADALKNCPTEKPVSEDLKRNVV